jgi:hypothetical protein
VRAGDVLVVWKLDRLGRSLSHLLCIVNTLKEKQVAFRSLTEGMDTTTASGELLFHVFGAVLQMKVGDYFVQGRRRWVRLHEKGGKEHDVPCHHNLDHFLDGYIAAAGIAGDANGYLFRTTMRRSGILTEKPLHQQDAYRIIQKRTKAAGIETKSYLPGDRHHCLSKEQRQAGSGATHRQS